MPMPHFRSPVIVRRFAFGGCSSIRYPLVAAALFIAACGDRRRIPIVDVGGGMRPFRELHGVELGMTAAELRRARPSAQPASGSGFQELLGDRRIGYVIPGTAEHGTPSDRGLLQEVSAEQRSTGADETVSIWRQALKETTLRIGQPSRCLRYSNGDISGYEAVWRTEAVELHLSVYTVQRTAAASSLGAARGVVIARVRRREKQPWWLAMLLPADASSSLRHEMPCSNYAHMSYRAYRQFGS